MFVPPVPVPLVLICDVDDLAPPNKLGGLEVGMGDSLVGVGGLSGDDDLKLNVAGVCGLKLNPDDGLLAPKANPANGLGFTASSYQ